MPSGKTIKNLKFDENYFYLEDDFIVFRVPAGGKTTKNSKFSRTELRHKEEWKTTTQEDRTLYVEMKITELPPIRPCVCVAQIHDSKSDLVMVRLFGKELQIRLNGKEFSTIDENYELGTLFELTIKVNNRKLYIKYNEKNVVETMISLRKKCYFKTGAYIQTNPEKYNEDPKSCATVLIKKSLLIQS